MTAQSTVVLVGVNADLASFGGEAARTFGNTQPATSAFFSVYGNPTHDALSAAVHDNFACPPYDVKEKLKSGMSTPSAHAGGGQCCSRETQETPRNQPFTQGKERPQRNIDTAWRFMAFFIKRSALNAHITHRTGGLWGKGAGRVIGKP
jgi:hypothetical protein